MKHITTAFFALLSLASSAQQSDKYSLSLSSGLKHSGFEYVREEIRASNVTGSFKAEDIKPQVNNTVSFFAELKGNKTLSNRFSITNSVGLDMQQLNIVSGWKKDPDSNPAITGYYQTNHTELLPRLKMDFGVNTRLFPVREGQVNLGVSAGQMIALSSSATSYSFVGSNLSLTGKRMALSLSGSLTPYNVELKNFENYVGNKGAGDVDAYFAFRIYEVGLGLSYRL